MKSEDKKNGDFCPIARTAELLGDHCSLLIVRDLLEGPKRFKDLEESLSPVSSRTITNKLKALLEHNLITRTKFKEKPPRVVYALTKEGKKLHDLIEEMRKFGEKLL